MAKEKNNQLVETAENAVQETLNPTVDALLSALHGDYSHTETIEQKDGSIIESVRFTLTKKMGQVTEKSFTSPELVKLTNSFLALNAVESVSTRLKCVILSKVDSLRNEDGSSVLSSNGFRNVGEYAFHLFGIKDTTARQYANMGRYFYDENGKMKDSRLPLLGVSQLIPLLARVEGKDTDTPSTDRIASFFEKDSDGASLLNGAMPASKITARLKAFDEGILDSHGQPLLSLEEQKERKEEEKKAKAAQSTQSVQSNGQKAEAEQESKAVQNPVLNACALYIETRKRFAALDIQSFTEEAREAVQTVLNALDGATSAIEKIVSANTAEADK